MDKKEATPRPPCDGDCGVQNPDTCARFHECPAWRAWFAQEWDKACAAVRPFIKVTKTEELKVATDMKLRPWRFFGTKTGTGVIYEPEEGEGK